MPKLFDVPTELRAPCEICRTPAALKYATEIAGKVVCIQCARYKPMVHVVRYVEFMAAKECQNSHGDIDIAPPAYCNLDCKCDPCSARKVLRFVDAWHRSK
jgi:hypothetical protein